jgi:hypothetical protein
MMVISDPSQAHPGAYAKQVTPERATQVPAAVQPVDCRKAHACPLGQSESFLHVPPPASDAGAHWQVSQPFLSLRTPLGHLDAQAPPSGGQLGEHWQVSQPFWSLSTPFAQLGKQPSAGHGFGDPASTAGHGGKSQPQRPLGSLAQTVRPRAVPSGHSLASSVAPRPAQSAGVQSLPASMAPPSMAPGSPGFAIAPLHPADPAKKAKASGPADRPRIRSRAPRDWAFDLGYWAIIQFSRCSAFRTSRPPLFWEDECCPSRMRRAERFSPSSEYQVGDSCGPGKPSSVPKCASTTRAPLGLSRTQPDGLVGARP